MAIRGKAFFLPLLIAAVATAGGLLAPAAAAEPLRICADPDNLPFSHEQGPQHGLYVELAELVARKLDMPLETTWWYTHMQRRALRNTIQVNECDATFALPANSDYRARGVRKSKPFLDVGYALVSAPGLSVASLESLKGKRLAVQFSTTPHIVLSTHEGYAYTTFRNPDEVFAALARGEVDVGLLWGPVAGYDNKTKYQSRWQVVPVAGHDFDGQVVVGVRADRDELRQRIDQALADLQPDIRDLAVKYGFPTARPINLETKPGSALGRAALQAVRIPAHAWVTVADEAKPAPKPAAKASAPARPAPKANAKAAATTPTAVAAAAAEPAPVLEPTAQAGRVRFNDQCSHCHGSDGASPVRERDVRRLTMRYDSKWKEVANTTIRNGRSDLGMPPWKDSLADAQIVELISFLATIQK